MNEVSLKPVIDELETLFSKFNKAFFEGKLEKPVITVSPDHTRGAYGWCTAEAHGLTVEKGEKYGWHKTTLNPQAEAFVKSLGKSGFCLVRPRTNPLKGSRKGGGSSSRKYVCPCCGTIIRATKEVHVLCGECEVAFEEQE